MREYSEEAILSFQKVVDESPEHPSASYALGLCYFGIGKLSLSKEYLAKAKELSLSEKRSRHIEGLLNNISEMLKQKKR